MAAAISWAAFVGGLWIFGSQVYHWMQSAVWQSFSVIHGLALVLPGNEWVAKPTSWLGVHAALRWLPASGVLLAVAFLAMLVALADGPDRRSGA